MKPEVSIVGAETAFPESDQGLARGWPDRPARPDGGERAGFRRPGQSAGFALGWRWREGLPVVRSGVWFAERKRIGARRKPGPACLSAIERRFGGGRDIAGRRRSAAAILGKTP